MLYLLFNFLCLNVLIVAEIEGLNMSHKGFKKNTSNIVVLYGRHAVFAALENQKRQIIQLICTPENRTELEQKFPHLSPVLKTKKEIEAIVGPNAIHQGFVLTASPLENIYLQDLCEQTQNLAKCRVLILDQVTDPQNVGAIIRSAAAFNASAVIVQDKNTPSESGVIAKASAGTIEFLPLIRVTNLSRAIEILKKSGFWIVGMDAHAQQKIDEIDKNSKLAIIMGSEGSGMRRLIQESCDITVRLDINPCVESLNVSTAASIILYELNK